MRDKVQNRKIKLLPAILAVALAAVLIAPLGSGFARGAESTGKLSLTVQGAGTDIIDGLKEANARADLYQIATGKKDSRYDTWHWTLIKDYNSLAEDDRFSGLIDEDGTIIDDKMSNAEYTALAEAAADLALAADSTLTASQSVDIKNGIAEFSEVTNGAGLYVIIPRDKSATDDSDIRRDGEHIQTAINTAKQTYTYSPSITALPGKDAKEDGSIGTAADYGPWKNDVTVVLKPEVSDRKGQIKIIKNLQHYETKNPVTFVFSVKAFMEGNPDPVYSDVVSMSFGDDSQTPESRTNPGKDERIIDGLPIGATVAVEEIYPAGENAYYKLVSVASPEEGATVTADQILEFTFTNDYNDRYHGGGGAENQYLYDDADGTLNWETRQIINGQEVKNSKEQGEADQ